MTTIQLAQSNLAQTGLNGNMEQINYLPDSKGLLEQVIGNPWFATIAVLFFLLIVLIIVVALVRRSMTRANNIAVTSQHLIFLVTVPKFSLEQGEPQYTPDKIKEQISLAENFFSVLGGLRAQRGLRHWLKGRTDHFSLEIVSHGDLISFYFAIPSFLEESFRQQLLSAYPHAQLELVEDYNVFLPKSQISGCYLKFGREFLFPLKTYRKMDYDPLDAVANSLSKLPGDCGAVVQIVARSAHKRWHQKGVLFAREVQKGVPLANAIKKFSGVSGFSVLIKIIEGFFSIFKSPQAKKKNEEQEQPVRLSAMEEEVVRGVEEKTSKAGFDVNIRLVVSASTKSEAEKNLNGIISSFAQYNVYEYGNGLKQVKPASFANFVSDFIHRAFLDKYNSVLNAEEVVSLFHLPLPSSQTPKINWLAARQAPPPVNLPAAGIILGYNEYRGTQTIVRIKNEDRQRHVYVIGKSGTGKSVLQANMIIQDIQNGEGVCLVDPHGDLAEYIIEHIPVSRLEDVIIFDPSDYERPIGLNMLEFNDPEQKTLVINEMINIFDKLYDLRQTGGPMFEQYMRNAILLMMEDTASGATLLEVPKVLADANFRRYKLSRCQNPIVKDFWEKEAEKAGGEASLANMVPYITSKLTPFVSSDLVRPIISQNQSSFNFRQIMDSKKIFLVKLSKGKIGELSANLLGMIVVSKLLIAALSRADLAEEERSNYFLYIDEFQNFITETISIILSEARKYRLCLTIAHQFIGQLVKDKDTRIRDAVFGNAGTMISFRIGPDDAEFLAKQYEPVFKSYDLINVPKYNAYLKLLIDNQTPPAFNLKPLPPQVGDRALSLKIKEFSRQKYGRPRAEIEKEILDRIKLSSYQPL